VQLAIDLTWIGAVGMVVGGLLAPVEALGWWAGWYGDEIQTIELQDDETPSAPLTPAHSRYVVYLDGIGQSTNQYQPAVARFLLELEQRLPPNICLVKGLMSYLRHRAALWVLRTNQVGGYDPDIEPIAPITL
jgi:hypothetical protein